MAADVLVLKIASTIIINVHGSRRHRTVGADEGATRRHGVIQFVCLLNARLVRLIENERCTRWFSLSFRYS